MKETTQKANRGSLVTADQTKVRVVKPDGTMIETNNDVKPGCYMFPCGESMQDWDSPEMKVKREQGPLGILTVVGPDGFNMGKSLMIWFAYSLLIGVLIAYAGWHALGAGAAYLAVFRVTATAAILGYAVGYIHNSIWKGESWTTTAKFIFDGLLYALVTAGTFGWLWPALAS